MAALSVRLLVINAMMVVLVTGFWVARCLAKVSRSVPMTLASSVLSRLVLWLLLRREIRATSHEPGGTGLGLLGAALS